MRVIELMNIVSLDINLYYGYYLNDLTVVYLLADTSIFVQEVSLQAHL